MISISIRLVSGIALMCISCSLLAADDWKKSEDKMPYLYSTGSGKAWWYVDERPEGKKKIIELYKSNVLGGPWQKLVDVVEIYNKFGVANEPGCCDVLANDKVVVVFSNQNNVYVSSRDGGKTWNESPLLKKDSTGQFPTGKSRILLSGNGTIYSAYANGLDCSPDRESDSTFTKYPFENSSAVHYLLLADTFYVSGGGKVWSTSDCGNSWLAENMAPTVIAYADSIAETKSHIFISNGENEIFYKEKTSGSSWQTIHVDLGPKFEGSRFSMYSDGDSLLLNHYVFSLKTNKSYSVNSKVTIIDGSASVGRVQRMPRPAAVSGPLEYRMERGVLYAIKEREDGNSDMWYLAGYKIR